MRNSQFLVLAILLSVQPDGSRFPIRGTVTGDGSPLDSARVRIQGSSTFAYTDAAGRFEFAATSDSGAFVVVCAGKEGWYSDDRTFQVGDSSVTIPLQSLPPGDHPEYQWASPEYCRTCHAGLFADWTTARHSRAATNPMLLQIYNGTDVHGNPGVAPGFKLDFPFRGGDCADCHAPTAALFNPGDTDLNDVLLLGGVDTNGVHCDFCHKVRDVPVNYRTGVNGSILVQRPPAGSPRGINAGSLDDVTSYWMGGTYNDVYGKSDFCSGCHQYANENSVIVDDTYDSWLRSSFGKDGVRCQDCHMKPARDSIIVSDIGLIDAVRRDPERLTNHLFQKRRPGDLSQTATLDVSQRIVADTLVLTVTVTNRLAGHNLPTGVSLRNILLVLNVRAGNQEVRQVFGMILPGFAGTGSPVEGNYSGQPGKAFALITQGATGDWPVPNWLATGIHSDTRIPSGGADSEEFGFRIVSGDPITVSAELIYRAVYKPWADAKGWNMRQSMMADTTFVVQTVGLTSADPVVGSLELFQNYPNPFNPVTTVSFRLSVASEVRLSVYDVLGREVEVLVNERKSPGRHDVAFDASGLASGVYLYRLQAGTFAQTRKMAITR